MCALLILLSGCDCATQKTKQTINKTGELVTKTGSEFMDGATKGKQKTFAEEPTISQQLTDKGLGLGTISIHSTDSASDNVLTAYLIFDKDIDQKIMVKLFTESHKEYGRK